MSHILVVADHLEGKLRKATLPTIGFAKKAQELTGGKIIGLVLGSGAAGVAAELATSGVDQVISVDGPQYANYLAEAYAPAVAAVAKQVGASVIAAPATTTGKDFLPRAAARLDGGFISDAIAVYSHGGKLAFKRPMWAGNLIANEVSDAAITAVTVRTTNFDAPARGAAVGIETLTLGLAAPGDAQFVSFDQVKSTRPELTDAARIVAGGRGLKSADAFKMLEELADVIGAAVGASRAAVDSGYAPNDWQIGQTGKIVAPQLYFAVAISGAIQHLAGMKGSKVIVSINKDGEAPIYQISDYGLVADAFKAVPELTAKLKG
jgi:electron transfer flavoprotein alpha subunit